MDEIIMADADALYRKLMAVNRHGSGWWRHRGKHHLYTSKHYAARTGWLER